MILMFFLGSPPYFHLGTMQALFKMVEDAHPPIPEGYSSDLNDFLFKVMFFWFLFVSKVFFFSLVLSFRKCFTKDYKNRATAKDLLNHAFIVKNGEAKKIKRDELEGTLKSINQTPRVSAKSLFENNPSSSSSSSNETKVKLQRVKKELKEMHAEYQNLQLEILSAQKKKSALEKEISNLRSSKN